MNTEGTPTAPANAVVRRQIRRGPESEALRRFRELRRQLRPAMDAQAEVAERDWREAQSEIEEQRDLTAYEFLIPYLEHRLRSLIEATELMLVISDESGWTKFRNQSHRRWPQSNVDRIAEAEERLFKARRGEYPAMC